MIGQGFWVWGGRPQGPLSPHPQYVPSIIVTAVVDLDHLAEVVFVKFLHSKLTLFYPFQTVLFGIESLCGALPWEWAVMCLPDSV